MKIYKIAFPIALFIIIASCNNDNNTSSGKNPDYSNSYYWASSASPTVKDVDVFYVYPTLFGGTGEMNMDITDEIMRARVQTVLLKQASVFAESCNIFAPYYRQTAMECLGFEAAERNKYFSIGMENIEQAFDYYIENLNHGRPFILAGHSQGSLVLINLMKDKFTDPALMDKLIAAYIIGYSITENDISEFECFQLAESAEDIGVVISYNTQSETAEESPVLLPNARCVNPLNWKNTSEYAPKELNLGAVFFKNNGEVDTIIPEFTDARISEKGALIVYSPDAETYSSPDFPLGVYHKLDYSFFYNNLVKNVNTRINTYFLHKEKKK